MRGRTCFLIGIAAGLCGVPFACTRSLHPERRCHDLVPIVVLADDVPAGTVMTLDHLSLRSVHQTLATTSNVKPDAASDVIGQILMTDLRAGDALRWSDFSRQRELLKPHTRLFTIMLEPDRALVGQLFKNDHVDVLAAVTDPAAGGRIVQTVIQNAIVVGVTARTAPELTAVQLLVTAEQAQQLLLAQEAARLALSLRNPAEADPPQQLGQTTLGTLLRGRAPLRDPTK